MQQRQEDLYVIREFFIFVIRNKLIYILNIWHRLFSKWFSFEFIALFKRKSYKKLLDISQKLKNSLCLILPNKFVGKQT